MTQAQLERAVAQATGESISTIRCRGFSVVEMPMVHDYGAAATPQVVDWDELDLARMRLLPNPLMRQSIIA